MAAEKIQKISGLGEKLKPRPVPVEPNRDHFEALMQQRSVKTEAAGLENKPSTEKAPSLMDEVRNLNQKTTQLVRATPEALSHQADDVIAQIDDLKHKLQTPDLELKGSTQNVLRNKLTHMDESLRIALERAGLEYTPAKLKPASGMQPIERFLGLLTNGQHQLSKLSTDIQALNATDGELSPSNMLLIQIKVNHIQQEVELFTSMLNKALESTKTIMNVQV